MIAPRNAAALASLVILAAAAGCTSFYEIPIETPIQPKMDVTPFTRVLVAGFIGGGTDDVDANLETVRLLRSQLRSKSTLRVIEAEVLPLEEIARDQAKSVPAGGGPAPSGSVAGGGTSSGSSAPGATPSGGSSTGASSSGGSSSGSAPPAAAPSGPPEILPVEPLPPGGAPVESAAPAPTAAGGSETQSPAPVPQLGSGPQDEGKIRNEKDLERFQSIFDDSAFWKKLGEEHQNPLIVTGTVLFTNTQTSGFVTTNREIIDPLGRRVVQPYRVYMERKGFIIEPRFIFIDGRTGTVLYSDRFHEEILYPAQQNTPALSSYFELMDRLIPSFLGSLSTQRIRGTRVLLK
jgi:hypothetical protein